MVSDKKSSENVSPSPQCRPALGQQDMEYIPNTQGGGTRVQNGDPLTNGHEER